MSYNSRWLVPLLTLHLILLLLASTQFTIVTVWTGDHDWTWNYFQFARSSGFGYEYVSPYSLPVVLTYVVACVAGMGGYLLAWRRGWFIVGLLGAFLSVAGLLSFSLEASHWLIAHHWSWIVSCPMIALPLATYSIVRAMLTRESAPPGLA